MNNGGPAFPVNIPEHFGGDKGMTLRDYFAAKAMHLYLFADGRADAEQTAKLAYQYADAMLKAREAA